MASEEAKKLVMRELARREMARRSYAFYLSYVHGAAWKDTSLSRFLAGTVQSFLEEESGDAFSVLVVATPPQHGKSMTITESLPSWYLIRNPEKRVIVASYNEDFAERFCRKNREKLEKCSVNLGGASLSKTRATELELSNSRGRMISRGIMSGITGNPADLVIIDDPIKNREEADSPTYRDKLWQEWQNSIKSRLSAGAKVILIMTPWHEDDLRARILSSEPRTRYVRLPVAAEEDDPMGREPGEPLCPELGKGAEWLEQYRESYIHDPQGGARAWQALYMCSPRVEGGDLVKREWWKTYRKTDMTAFGTEVISVDATFKGSDSSDFVSVTVWGKRDGNYYLRYCLNRQMSFTQTLEALRLVKTLYPAAQRVLIEDKANGSAIIDTLGREMLCIPVNPKGGKVARVNAVSAAIESGHVFLPEGEPWLEEYLNQWTAFPAGAHDDMVDSTTQALSYLLFSCGELPPVPEEKTEEERRDMASETALADMDSIFDVYG